MIVKCPHCKEKVDVSALTPGTQSACPNCQGVFVTPDIPIAAPVIQPDAQPRSAGPPPKTSGLAIASLVLSILGFLTAFIGVGIILTVIALIFGISAMKQIKARPKEQGGYGLALAGAIIGGISTFIFFLSILATIAIPSFVKYRERANDASTIEQDSSLGYSESLSDLLSYSVSNPDDTDVTFIFGTFNSSRYSFTTSPSSSGDQTWEFTD